MKPDYLFFKQQEGKIFILGIILLISFFILLILCYIFIPKYIEELLSITASNIIFGRMAGLSIGISSQMDIMILIFFNLFIEAIMVFLLYPLFILSWYRLDLITYKPLNQFLEKSKTSATKYQPLIKKYGILGLIMFVITPFAMTGPVVGSFVGFLIGFSHRLTLYIILISTFTAITIWVYLIKNFEELLVRYNELIMQGFLILIIAIIVWYITKTIAIKLSRK